MSVETSDTGRRKRFVKWGVGAAIVLVAYPAGLVGFAARSSGVELGWSRGQEPVPPYEVDRHMGNKRADRFWVSVAENTLPSEMERIVRHLVQTEYSGNTRMIVFFYVGRDTSESGFGVADATFQWTLTGGVHRRR